MATQYLTFSGICKWAKYKKPDEKYGNYSIDLYLDEPSWDAFNYSGLGLTPKEDETGWYVKFRRPQSKIIKQELVNFGPPEVVGVPDDVLIGNGSKVSVNVVVYDTIKGKGHRLNKITVLDLIPYSSSPTQQAPEPPVVQEEVPAALVEPIVAPAKGKKRPF